MTRPDGSRALVCHVESLPFIVLTGLMLLASASHVGGAQSAASLPERWRGTWEIRELIGPAAISAMTDQQARALVGKTLILAEHHAAFDGESCVFTDYSVTEQKVEEFAAEYRTTTRDLRLPGRYVTTLTLTCPHTALPALTLLEDGSAVISRDGWFYRIVKRRGTHRSMGSRSGPRR